MPSERIFNPSEEGLRCHRPTPRETSLAAIYNPAAFVRFTRNLSLRRW